MHLGLPVLGRLYREQALAAITDQVTGLPNRRAAMNSIDEAIRNCQSSVCSFAIFFVDLDNFKRINDLWGHQAGDAVLNSIGQCLRLAIRETDFVGRYGGEEFTLVLTDISLEQARDIAERLRVALQHHTCTFEVEDKTIEVVITAPASAWRSIHSMARSPTSLSSRRTALCITRNSPGGIVSSSRMNRSRPNRAPLAYPRAPFHVMRYSRLSAKN